VTLDRDELFRALDSIPFDSGGWVVAGSGLLLAMGAVEGIDDIDIVADDDAWATAIELAGREPHPGLFGDHQLALDLDGIEVEVFDGWLGISAGSILAEAVEIDGYLFTPLERVADSKRTLSRPKDLIHLGIIEGLLDE
jgi:hypothetical protein